MANMTIEQIRESLKKIELEKGVRILFAVESGSRAWGFESPDSDYDVRFIYVHPLDWYLKIRPQKDTIERLDGDFDASGWDLLKTLRLYVQTNPSMLEWLLSPITYMDDGVTASKLRELLPNYFNVFNGVNHYYSIAKNHDERYLRNHGVTLKRFLYYLRRLLACRWIMDRGTTPPVLFTDLVKGTVTDDKILKAIDSLLERKKTSKEHDKDVVEPLLVDFGKTLAAEATAFLEDKTHAIPPCDKNAELDQLLYEMALATK